MLPVDFPIPSKLHVRLLRSLARFDFAASILGASTDHQFFLMIKDDQPVSYHYPVISCYITIINGKITIINGKIHYFYGNFQ